MGLLLNAAQTPDCAVILYSFSSFDGKVQISSVCGVLTGNRKEEGRRHRRRCSVQKGGLGFIRLTAAVLTRHVRVVYKDRSDSGNALHAYCLLSGHWLS